ncbi:urea ABC transporter substrate-binding protein [Mycobacterium sp. ENV421]|uniref:ABC transporter substrate-binding protein n=2 Tax=Mycolicibacterium TaxID=1866885 RepID=A0A064CBE7_9MYCO|nr:MULTISPECIES: urea ABC transporter substrate-binding protein [Mycobacteriaceae]KDE97660.1 ABC transporter substrate-binding protein [Mycolicibacterium aromaticivorans JS19b1 = JCM 16368]MCV7344475.1 urea ABC transporter substrate-binding protein [Mycolicibacterium rhodesiae]ORB57463.1 urea ABC transporter substrate-binding protein [Mycolicibacterium rhodesiae]PND58219.1 urea ABC transporter substrate-binding protein [Mycobacterium sp. ENV421]
MHLRRSALNRSFLAATGVAVTAGLILSGCGSKATETDTAKSDSCVDTSGPTIKVGSLNSLSGTMAISEVTVRDSIKLAVDEINAKGGVLGKQVQIVGEDGASDPAVFAQKAEKLIKNDCVAAVFGGWTSSSRKAMLPVFESNNALLYYPVQYEGLESSKNIFYTGATTNQQIVPALDFLKEKGITSLYLVGSDYVFPQTANRIIKAYAAANGIEIKGEDYTPLGSTDFSTIVNKVRSSNAGAVFNTLNGDSNVAFFKEYTNAGLTPQKMPVVSVSIAEEEVQGIGAQNIAGQLTAWNYYETLDNPVNKAFVKAFKDKYGQNRVTSDPMEAAYVSVYLWKNTVEKGKSFDVKAIQDNCAGVTFDAPEGLVTIDGENHHITKTARIGEIHPDGLIYTIWESPGPITPDPYLKSYPWAKGLSG